MSVNRAARSNVIYARRYQWSRYRTRVAEIIGAPNSDVGSSQFAQAVERWQRSHGIEPADGMLGPLTWNRLSREVPGATPPAVEPDAALWIASRENGWLVFNREAFRREVIQFLWGDSFSPTSEELYSRSSVESPLFELPDTHWGLPQSSFATRSNVYSSLRNNVRHQLQNAADSTARRPPRPPAWVPAHVWTSFLSGAEGVHDFPRSSPRNTTIRLIKRSGQISGYVEGPVDVGWLSQRMDPYEARLAAESNQKFNDFMRRRTDAGGHAGAAERAFRETVQITFALAFASVINFSTGLG